MAKLKPIEERDPAVGRVMAGFDRLHGTAKAAKEGPAIIGIAGRKGVGKDTAADHLVRNHGFVKISLADPLRDGLKAMLGLSDQCFDDRSAKESAIDWLGVSPRQLLQTLGTEWGRNCIDRDLWLRVAQRRIQALPNGARVVISDIRFEEEAAFVRRAGGVVVHIRRPMGCAEHDQHVSEAGVEIGLADRVVRNTGTVERLFEAMDQVAEAGDSIQGEQQ